VKVLMTGDTVGGVFAYCLELARALGPHGVEVVLATMGAPADAAQRRAVAALSNVELRESGYALEWMDDPWDDVASAGEWLLALADELRPDVVHLNGYAHGALPWPAPVLMVGHSCVVSWHRAVRGDEPPARWDRYRREVARGLAAADAVTAPTVAMLRELELSHEDPQRPIRFVGAISNARRPEEYPPGVPEEYVLAAGRLWDEAKNLRALAAVAPRLPWRVAVAGSPDPPDGGRLELPDVDLLGLLSPAEVAEQMGRASIYALPALYEPFGLSVVEAALAGCALVLGDIPTLREVWGDAATFVSPRDPDALLHSIRALIERPGLRRARARAARGRALGYGPEAMASAYLARYRDLS
jgi:glycogen synthase